MVEYLNGDEHEQRLNHAINPELIAINLNQFAQYAADKRQQIPALSDLKGIYVLAKCISFLR